MRLRTALAMALFGAAFAATSTGNAESPAPHAQPATGPEAPKTAAEAAPIADRAGVRLERDSSACLTDPAAIEDIRHRREELDAREQRLATLEAELKKRSQAVDEEVKRLETVRDEIARLDEINKKANDERLGKISETLEGMSPKGAAGIMNQLDEMVAVSAMNRMSPLRLGKILNLMEPGRSARLSEILAGAARAKIKKTASLGAAAAANPGRGGEETNGHQNNADAGNANGAGAGAGREPSGKR